jgi:hypothetical protein
MISIIMIYNHSIDIILIHYANEYIINLAIHNFFFISKVACPLISTFHKHNNALHPHLLTNTIH